jgi:hypothetical protein
MRATAFTICVLVSWLLAVTAVAGPAVLTVDPDSQTIGGGTTGTVVIMYDGTAVAEGLRGFHLTIDYDETLVTVADLEVDVWEGSFLSHVDPTAFYAVQVDANTIVVDCAILGETAGAFGTGDLCTIVFTGLEPYDGVSPVHFAEVTLRDVDNHAITWTADDGEIIVDITAPPPPTIYPEPTYTQGTTNTLYWTDMSAYGAVGYCIECSESPTFVPLHGTSGCTPLLQHTFTDLEDGVLYYYRVKCRDMWWNVSDWSSPLTVSTQDDSPPITAAGPLNPYYNTVMFNVPFTASDATSGVQYVELYFQVDGGGYSKYGGTYTTSPIAFVASGQGVYDFYTIGTDNVGNIESAPVVPDCSTEVDLTPPAAVTDMDARPGHNKIHLSWTVSAFRASPVEGTLIVRKPWGVGAYPEYDDWGAPVGYPAHPADGTVVAFVPGTGAKTYDDTGFTDATRNIYYYTAFARDAAGNYSAAASTAQDRATSYWLADVSTPSGAPGVYDGLVDYYDKVVLSSCYWTQHGSPFYKNEMDVGPTDDWSRFGIPLTDNWVNFEDLMVLAMNYGRVSPAGRVVVEALTGGATGGGTTLALRHVGGAVEAGQEIAVDLVLDGNDARVKGVSAAVSFDAGRLELVGVAPSYGVAGLGSDAFFIWRREGAGAALIDLALLGTDRVLGGSGPLARLTFRVVRADAALVALDGAAVRDSDNADVGAALVSLALNAAGEPPAWALDQNTPNPFNPRTTIAFEIAEPCDVRLAVYSTSGRLVRELVNARVDAGRRAVVWDGVDERGGAVGSGVYLCVLEAGGRRIERKMVLMK